MSTISIVFLLMVVYQLKHFIADYPLQQNEYMLGKFRPGWDFVCPLLTHVSVHFSFTTLISATVLAYFNHPAPFGFGMLIGLCDACVHFIMDRIKAGPKYMGRWKSLSAYDYGQMREILDPETEGVTEEGKFYARRHLRRNSLFWVSLGFDQLVHHLTDIAAAYAVLKIAGAL